MEERRASDPVISEIRTRLVDHIDRYERDWKHTQEWRTDMNKRLAVHCDFIKEVSPIYKTLCKFLSAAVIVSIGLAITAFWKHFGWH